jgi:hypothetical protein
MLIATTAILACSLALPPPAPEASSLTLSAIPEEQDSEPDAGQTGEERLRTILDQYDAAMEAYQEAYQAVKPEDRRQFRRERYPDAEDYVSRLLTLARDFEKTEVAAEALSWVATKTGNSASIEEAVTTLVRNHIESERLVNICSLLEEQFGEGTDLLAKILEESPHRKVKGTACLSLGRNLAKGLALAEKLQSDPDSVAQNTSRYGAEMVGLALAADAEELLAGAEEYFSMVLVEFADIPASRGTLGRNAESELFVLLNLRIGVEAPDIEAEDIDGVTFKLSDYRGKVVVLDFWGNW